MASWFEGELKVRGERKNLKRFLLEGIGAASFCGNYEPTIKVVRENGDFVSLELLGIGERFYLKDTKRQIINQQKIWYSYPKRKNNTRIIVLENFMAANKIDVEGLKNLSIKFCIDFKLYAFQSGLETNRDVEIINGIVTKDETITFKDYNWECIRPNFGF